MSVYIPYMDCMGHIGLIELLLIVDCVDSEKL